MYSKVQCVHSEDFGSVLNPLTVKGGSEAPKSKVGLISFAEMLQLWGKKTIIIKISRST